MTNSLPGDKDLWFLPLGGCGEIGINMNLYGHDDQWLMVDCGIGFERVDGQDVIIMPDPAYIAERKDTLAALIITHAHEDHIGAVARLWPQLRCPIYATPYTAEILKAKLGERINDDPVPIHIVELEGARQIGPFHVEWFSLTHSIVEPSALVITTGAGTVFHTADWKLDSTPMVGKSYSEKRLRDLASRNLAAVVCDSTNATKPGRSASEQEVYYGLKKVIAEQKGRVVVTCFGSNIARLFSLSQIALEQGRYVTLLGRSLENRVAAARRCDYWHSEHSLLHPFELGYLPPKESLIIATGSQGEPRTALYKLAFEKHRLLDLEPSDTVIFSSRVIPGNEEAVQTLIDKLTSRGINCIQENDTKHTIHASGHPYQDELKDLYQWTKPRSCIPVHGEEKHLIANASVAKASGIPRQFTGVNGDLFKLAPFYTMEKGFAKAGRLIEKSR